MIRPLRLLAIGSSGAALALACLSPTQITVMATTDVECARVSTNGTSIYAGDPKAEPAIASTRACSVQRTRSEIGTLVLTPSGDKDERVELAVVLGVDVRSEDCAARNYDGCILAKRRVRYVPHEPLDMPIELSLSCKGITCDPTQTCFRGACIAAEFVAKNGCLGPECEAPSPTSAASDASADGGVGDGAAIDAQPATITRVVTTTAVPRGLALPTSAEIWWSESGPNGDSTIYAQAIDPAGDKRVVVNAAVEVFGIAVNSSRIAMATSNPSFGLQFRALDGGEPALYLQPPAIGVAFYDSNRSSVFVGGPDAAVGRPSTGGQWFSPPSTGYAEESATTIFYVSGAQILEVLGTDGGVVQSVSAGALGLRGIAASSGRWFVSTTTGLILAIDRTTQARTELSTGVLADVEDLVWDDARGRLYVAASQGGVPGIYTLTPPN